MSTLKQLHDLLLDKTKWPDEFEWDYGSTDNCALGLAYECDLVKRPPCHMSAHDLGMTRPWFQYIFFTPMRCSLCDWDRVRPEDIAFRIEHYITLHGEPNV